MCVYQLHVSFFYVRNQQNYLSNFDFVYIERNCIFHFKILIDFHVFFKIVVSLAQ